jgi:hypothetical protein
MVRRTWTWAGSSNWWREDETKTTPLSLLPSLPPSLPSHLSCQGHCILRRRRRRRRRRRKRKR